jgi:hypothetical protein
MGSIKAALTSDALGALFAVPESDWTAISKRVGLAIFAKSIAGYIAQRLPTFPDLLAACEQWQAVTFPALVAQSTGLAGFSNDSIQAFQRLQTTLVGLDPGKDLPAATRAQAQDALDQLAQQTRALNGAFGLLAADIAAFTAANDVVDSTIDAYVAQLGPTWEAISASTGAVDGATGIVLGASGAIASDLDNIASGAITITTTFLLGLDIEVALAQWNSLAAEASAFISLAKGQEQYLTGAWLSGGQ